MKISTHLKLGAVSLLFLSGFASASGMVPETSVVIVEQSDGEGSINLKNTDSFPVMLITTLQNTQDDKARLLTVTPPAARVDPGKSQRIRFMLTNPEPLKTERLERVLFEGIPPQQKNSSQVRMTVTQNLPVLIRPAGLARDSAPWKHLTWKKQGSNLVVSNTSPYVVRLAQGVQTLPDNARWMLPATYVLPGQTFTLKADGGHASNSANQVRISPASTWGYSVDTYNAPLTQ